MIRRPDYRALARARLREAIRRYLWRAEVDRQIVRHAQAYAPYLACLGRTFDEAAANLRRMAVAYHDAQPSAGDVGARMPRVGASLARVVYRVPDSPTPEPVRITHLGPRTPQ